MSKETGGPAFPVTLPSSESYQGHLPHDGMTLRDYFAAKALAAMIGLEHKEDYNRGAKGVPILAGFAYEYADAMLAARVQS